MFKRIKAVTFDLWQTLILEDRRLGMRRAQLRIDRIGAALSAAGLPFPQDRLWDAYWRCAAACDRVRAQERDVAFDEQIGVFLQQVRPGLAEELRPETVRRVTTAYDKSFLEYPPLMDPHAPSVLTALRDGGLTLGLVSNTGMTPGATSREYLDRLGLLPYFHTLVFSDEVGLSKPSEKIFELALGSLATAPEATVHVGDDRAKDVAGARRAGIRSVWINRADEPAQAPAPDATVRGLEGVVDALRGLDRG